MKLTTAVFISVLALLAAGVGAYFVMNGDDSPKDEPIHYEELRTDLKADDYIQYGIEVLNKSEEEQTTSQEIFLASLYPDVSDGVKVSTATVTYKDRSIVCDVYEIKSDRYDDTVTKAYLDQSSKAMYKSELIESGQTTRIHTLIDTNLDISKGADEQTIVVGSSIEMRATGSSMSPYAYVDGMVVVTEIYDGEDHINTRITRDSLMDSTAKSTVKSVSGDTVYATTDTGSGEGETDKETVAQYLMPISYSNMVKYYTERGDKISYGDKSTTSLTTDFGKKEVTVQKLTVTSTKDGGSVQGITVYYGPNDVSYLIEIEYKNAEHEYSSSAKMKLKSSSLLN